MDVKGIVERGDFRSMGWIWNTDGTVTVRIKPRGRAPGVNVRCEVDGRTGAAVIPEGDIAVEIRRERHV